MYTKNIIKLIIPVFALFILIPGCSKKSDETQADKTQTDKTTQTDNTLVDENSLQESDDDIASVDYKTFYDELSSKGEWVEIDGKELGLIDGNINYAKDLDNKESFFSKMLGVKSAYAQDNADAGAYFVWRPAQELAVSLNAGEEPVYKPYANGQWVNTDEGWYFKAPTPAEEITSHYGRWAYNDRMGWVWVPGRVWAPAWVDWRVNDDYVAWTPIPPHVYIVNDAVSVPVIDDADRYVIVEKKNFVEPQLYKYMYLENKNKIMIKEMKKVDGVMVINRTVINKGPEVSVIETVLGKPVEKVSIKKVDKRDDVKYTSNTYSVYAPKFKKVKNEKKNEYVSKPNKVVKFNEVTSAGTNKKEEKSEEKEMKKESKENEKEMKKESKEKEKENKDKVPEKKKSDDTNMKDGKDKNKGNDKSNDGNKDKGNKDKGKK